ncbi:MAG: IS1/IS1595 family N-terminal zinc-binding domain-containing protein, partial [Leptodesmis sp.]|uniref:IS1/IS1595 family N-terminal zinc-binding domain-containing protein n=1 Tax=Leptodesmis sp. TaxID=3100501 RepID=UPI003D0DA623
MSIISRFLRCPNCGSDNIMKNGTTRRGKQNYKCQNCGCQLVKNPQCNLHRLCGSSTSVVFPGCLYSDQNILFPVKSNDFNFTLSQLTAPTRGCGL